MSLSHGASDLPTPPAMIPHQAPPTQLPPPNGQQQMQPLTAASPYTAVHDNKKYALEVGQQPVRARMCGFGDKDRRPITPPPCIKLVVRDVNTNQEVDFNELDPTFFVLGVDLWSADGTQEVNLVRHAGMLPLNSISAATVTSYPPPLDRPEHMIMLNPPPAVPGYGGTQMPNPQMMYQSMPGAYRAMPSSMTVPMAPTGMHPQAYGAQHGMAPYSPAHGQFPTQQVVSVPVQQPPMSASGMFTRNLIGSLNVNAFRLSDTEGKVGFWFVLQDLSVRTEGTFRLRMSFFNVGSANGHTINKGQCPVLASCFSEAFQVFSAKKFPGVIESTPLSKCFASQGIKIPIRKDTPKTLSNREEYPEEDE
ncbi:MAG: hypothetical protein M1820_006713 [Bogoriella megaspora]|nr:MAG: hypothetical protein M1820_006713 [Bogoriella megaspora]